ncbi:jg4404 [Pararge aegeria aegeria]|uniref:Jg4404 protein n=1 Tax=Pararge aegeria aegeria TaxID=348720 RepID=A0A8S4RNI6_9NEOP|nr:jg4404 [Pararge aegeria aegeria]
MAENDDERLLEHANEASVTQKHKAIVDTESVCQLLSYTELENNHDCSTNCYRAIAYRYQPIQNNKCLILFILTLYKEFRTLGFSAVSVPKNTEEHTVTLADDSRRALKGALKG